MTVEHVSYDGHPFCFGTMEPLEEYDPIRIASHPTNNAHQESDMSIRTAIDSGMDSNWSTSIVTKQGSILDAQRGRNLIPNQLMGGVACGTNSNVTKIVDQHTPVTVGDSFSPWLNSLMTEMGPDDVLQSADDEVDDIVDILTSYGDC